MGIPRGANPLASPTQPRCVAIPHTGDTVTLVREVMAGRTCQRQFKNSIAEPVWSPAPLASVQRAASTPLSLNDLLDGVTTSRFYRVVLLQ